MNPRERQILRKNEKFLRDNLKASCIIPHLIQDSVINLDDAERNDKYCTNNDKNYQLLRLLEIHPNGFQSFIEALQEENMDFIAVRLTTTEVNEEQLREEKDEYEKEISDVLRKTFCFDPDINKYIILDNIEEEVRLAFRISGEVYNVHIDRLRELVKIQFKQCTPYKRKRTREWAFKCLKRIRPVDEVVQSSITDGAEGPTQETDKKHIDQVDSLEDTTKGSIEKTEVHKRKLLDDLSEHELVQLLSPRLEEFRIPSDITVTLIQEEITGYVYKRLTAEYMSEMFPELSKGKRLSLLYLRDDILKNENDLTIEDANAQESAKSSDTDMVDSSEGTSNVGFRETFRKFDKDVSEIDHYRQNAILTTYNNRPGNLIDPIHLFSFPSNKKDQDQKIIYEKISNDIIEFVAACLNERSNGTIHLGINPQIGEYQIEGEVKGLQLNITKCLNKIYEVLENRFYREQHSTVLKCMRTPKFVEVTSTTKLPNKMYVLEVDVVPQSSLVNGEAFFIKSRQEQKATLFLFSKHGITPQCVQDEACVTYMSKHKDMITESRKSQEQHNGIPDIKQDLRQKTIDLISSGEESMSAALYPLLFLSPFDSNTANKIDLENFEFLVDLDANAVFDFDFASDRKGLYSFLDSDKGRALKALTTDNFDSNSEENQFKPESFTNLLDDIRTSSLKPWIFCNGYEAMSKPSLGILDWKKVRSRGYKEAVRFYVNEIPQGRGLVIFFLLSKDYDVMLEAAEEVILNFQSQWIVFAENDDIANHWKAEIAKRHIVDKRTIDYRCVIGMPWIHLNQTIKQLTGCSRTNRCEIPTSSGAFCHLKEKKKNDLVDLEILSCNECDDSELERDEIRLRKLRREEEEKFYKGQNVSWWNFWFDNQVLKREIHDQLIKRVEEALEGKSAEEDNKIGLVNIYHQPGAGGTTTAKHILWDLRKKYRCCTVKQITNQTVDQITLLRNYEEPNDPKPPLVLIENEEEEKVGEMFALLQNTGRIVARRSNDMKVFCVLLLCSRRTNIEHFDSSSVALKHELSAAEQRWFRNKSRDLEQQFQNTRQGTDPKFLISFNILKENFNTEYIHRTAVELVKEVTDMNERKLLKYLSMLNTFDLEWQPIPISAFDSIMTTTQYGSRISYGLAGQRRKHLSKAWEQTISQPLQILLNRTNRSGFGGQLKALSIVNHLFAGEIFSCFNQPPDTTSKIFMEFLESSILKVKDRSCNEVKKVVRTIMKKREERDDTGKVKFSPLIMKLLEDENEDIAAKVLVKGFEMTDDPMVCQQIARLYIHCKNWTLAAKYAKIATDMKPKSSFLWDTYGQVYKNQLYDKFSAFLQERKSITDDDIVEAIKLAQSGLQWFRKEQEVSELEHFNTANDAGYFGEIRMIVLLLDVLRFGPLGQKKGNLHQYLTDKNYFPKDMPKLEPEHIDFMKSLERRSDLTLKTLEDKTIQLKDDTYFSLFGQNMPRRNALATIRENLDSYFGEDTNTVPPYLSDTDKAEFRRRRVKRLGGRTLTNFRHIADKDDLNIILTFMLDNVQSEAWEPFDIITIINVVIALRLLKLEQKLITYDKIVQLSKKCYDAVVSSSEIRIELEAYMYFVLINWPTAARRHASQHLCPTVLIKEATKKWKVAFYVKHPRQKESKENRPNRKRETTNFFLGRGTGMDAIVHNEELHDPKGRKFVKGDSIWDSPDFKTKLLRLEGTLVNEGTEILCTLETGSGGTLQIPVPTSIPIGDKSLWQKCVFFVLGFSWAGIKAYDVRKDSPTMPNQSTVNQHNIGNSRPKAKRQSEDKQTHESFTKKLDDVRKQIGKISRAIETREMTADKRKYLESRQTKLEKELVHILAKRKEFYGN